MSAEIIQSVAREVEVTRRLYRSGESEYLIDGQVAQALRALLAHHPRDRVRDIALAAAVRAGDCGHALVERTAPIDLKTT